eukprot:8670207-Heterocapsa_arctica.AAC.2
MSHAEQQIEGGIHPDTAEYWEGFNTQTGGTRGPVNYFRRTVQKLGWKDNTPTNFTDHNGVTRELDEWHDFVYDGTKRARQQAWEKSAKNRPNYKGLEKGVDEATTIFFYKQLSHTYVMNAGALHTILADGVWTPRRAHNI